MGSNCYSIGYEYACLRRVINMATIGFPLLVLEFLELDSWKRGTNIVIGHKSAAELVRAFFAVQLLEWDELDKFHFYIKKLSAVLGAVHRSASLGEYSTRVQRRLILETEIDSGGRVIDVKITLGRGGCRRTPSIVHEKTTIGIETGIEPDNGTRIKITADWSFNSARAAPGPPLHPVTATQVSDRLSFSVPSSFSIVEFRRSGRSGDPPLHHHSPETTVTVEDDVGVPTDNSS
ncbi:hypothetical protein EVAR_78157_1 [Eumeta japonica]|uniref:Uncharacterized protein n=1 Tax=Eumeta variegata TaxID=151549 RepID=A0A4C1UYP4_EUMVA|nr:hypothetical protein EVAR_78157_1 [Eumeta japonica]